jgi:hypothetical protein
LPKQEIEVLTTNLAELPVIRAWTSLGYAAPGRVEILRRKNKSVIYGLVGAGRGGSDVIAKSCWRQIAVVEHRIYAEVLAHMPFEVLGYYGFAEGEGGNPATQRFSWLFLEDARGEELDPSNPEHRDALTRWLARMHTASSSLAAAAELPHRGPGHYREHLRSARRTIRQNYGNPNLSPADREVIEQVLDRLDLIEARWGDVEAACREMPWSLMHGDIAERNVQIRQDGAGLSLFVFDWEVGGWGLAPVDLAHADVELYASLVRDTWPTLDLETLQRQVNLCKLMRGGLAATDWSAESLATAWVERPIRKMIIYYARMTDSLRALGWLH